MKRQKLCILILATLGLGSMFTSGSLSSSVMAQTLGKRWGGGFGIGANQLYSDLAQTGNGLGIEGHVTRRLGSRSGLSLGLSYGQLPFTVPQNLVATSGLQPDFKTNFIRGDLRFVFELAAGSNIRPYLAFGISAINFQVTGKDTTGRTVKPVLAGNGVTRFNDGAVLAGGGLRFMLGPRMALDLGGRFSYTTGDDFDASTITKAKDAIITVMAGLTFFGAGGTGTDLYTEQVPIEEVDSSDVFSLEDRIDQLETTQQQPQDMQEYIRLKSRMDELNQQIEQKESEIGVLRTAVQDKKENVDVLENKLAATPAAGSAPSFSRSYEDALSKFYAKRYQEAIEQFNALVAQFPDHSLASNCAYWVGESHFGAANYRDSINAFNKVLSYPKSLKKDDALLMLGRAHLQLNQKDEARQAFNRLISEYPTSEFVGKAEAWLNKM
jgi:tol-pal system protein YbgF